MKKERKPLTTREKVLIGVGVVGACVAGYFGYKYFNELKIAKDQKNTINDLIKDLMSKDTEAEIAKKIALEAMDAANNQEVINDITREELNFMRFLIVESGCTKMALQNGENKLSRIRKKIAAEIENLALNPNDKQTEVSLMNHQKFEATLIDKIEKTVELDRLIDADENIYA